MFLSSIDGIRRLMPLMDLIGLKAYPLHSQLEQRQRLKNLDRFVSHSKFRVMLNRLILVSNRRPIRYFWLRTSLLAGWTFLQSIMSCTTSYRALQMLTYIGMGGLLVPLATASVCSCARRTSAVSSMAYYQA